MIRGEVKLSLYAENTEDSTQKLLELINKFSKVAGYKINLQKYVAFLYTNNEISEIESKEKKKKRILFKITTKRNKRKPETKNLGINLTKEVKNLYGEK